MRTAFVSYRGCNSGRIYSATDHLKPLTHPIIYVREQEAWASGVIPFHEEGVTLAKGRAASCSYYYKVLAEYVVPQESAGVGEGYMTFRTVCQKTCCSNAVPTPTSLFHYPKHCMLS
ncbi:uncharacterized protein [Macrobrachium rosenbergii]